jgi:hypothetical protein
MGFSCQPSNTRPALCSSVSCSLKTKTMNILKCQMNVSYKQCALLLNMAIAVRGQESELTDIDFCMKNFLLKLSVPDLSEEGTPRHLG